MTITVTAFAPPPEGGRGLERDTRPPWALEEVRQPCQVRGVSLHALKQPRIERFILRPDSDL